METKKAFWVLIALIFVLLSGCSKPITFEKPLTFKKASSNATKEEASEGIVLKEKEEKTKVFEPEPIEVPQYKPKEPKKFLPPVPSRKEEELEEKAVIDYKSLVGVKEPLILNVESMPLNDFIIYALGELLKVPFIMDENVMKMTNPVTLRLPRALKPEEILEAVVSYLRDQRLEVKQKGNVLSITKPKEVQPPPPPVKEIVIGSTPVETSERIAQFVPLKFLRVFDLQIFLNDFIKDKSVEIKSYQKENALLLIGPGYQIKQVLEIVNLLDVPSFSEKRVYFYKITFWQVDDFVKELSNLLSKFGYPIANNLNEPGILFIPVKSLNGFITAVPDEKTQSFVLEWIKKLDSPEAAGTETRFYIYKPLYSKAVDLASSLNNLIAGKISTQAQAPPQAPPSPKKAPLPTPQTTTPEVTSFSAQGITISADEKRNLLLISATPSQYQLILQILKELDKPPKQVLIEATILELTLKDELKLGLEWYLKNRLAEGNFTLGQILGVPTSPGFTFTFITDSQRFNLLINAFASKGLTNILSTPRLMVLDNQAATIQVGTDVPVVTGEVTTAEAAAGAATGVVRSIQYRNTGVILTVKPTIYTEGLLQLEITQEVSEMGASPPGIASPTILVRRINTNVVAGDGQTIVLGGLISNTQGREESKVPLLGDIPLLGNLFKSQSREERKTELIVLLTPHIIKNLEEAKDVTEELKSRLKWLK